MNINTSTKEGMVDDLWECGATTEEVIGLAKAILSEGEQRNLYDAWNKNIDSWREKSSKTEIDKVGMSRAKIVVENPAIE